MTTRATKLTKTPTKVARDKAQDARAARVQAEPLRREVQAQELAFVAAWMRTRNVGKAWKIACDPRDNRQVAEDTAQRLGAEMLAKPSIARAIDQKLARAARSLEVDAQRLVQELWDVATASPADLVQVRIHNCRHCHGDGGAYQWTGPQEYARACAMVREANEGRRMKKPMPNDWGGYGFRFNGKVNPECSSCGGGGEPILWMKDTRDYTDQDRLLFDGVKQTKYGMEIQLRNRDTAIANIARILGLMTPATAESNDPMHTFDKRSAASVDNLPQTAQQLTRLYHDFIDHES